MSWTTDASKLLLFSDASFAPATTTAAASDCKSHTGVAIMLAGTLLFWKSYRQSIVAQSSAEAELYAALDAYQFGTGVAELLKELFGQSVKKELVVDSSATVGILTDSKTTNWRTRHLKIKGAGIREAYQNNDLAISHTSGLTQVADVFTKAFDQNTLLRF